MPEVELPRPDELREQAEDRFTRRVALVTAVYAVILAIASLGGSNSMKDMLLAQQQASDQWAYYQAKVVREHLYRAQAQRLELDIEERGAALRPEIRARVEALRTRLADEEKRYAFEKKDIEATAKKLERERDVNRDRDPYFDYAEVFLQIAIVMSSVSILSKSRSTLWFSLGLALIGAACTVNGFGLFVRLPFLHGGH